MGMWSMIRSFCLLLFLGSVVNAASIPEATLNTLRKSIVRIDASQCDGDPRSGSGFIWQSKAKAVTALHVVSGCNKVGVYFEAQKVSKTAVIFKTLKMADLALLLIDDPPDDSEPLQVSPAPPHVNDDLTVLGYPLLIPHMNTTSLKLRFGGNHLKEIVPSTVRTELANIGSPSLDVEITNIEGHLVPGLSGAPVLNDSAKVVAIADGGLENGTVGISWGMPYRYLSELATSAEKQTTVPFNAHLFAAENEIEAHGTEVTCGGATFKKIRTLDYSQIMHSTDDPSGLSQLIAAANAYGVDPSKFTYDVYQDQKSGAAFVTLSGKEVTESDGRCNSELDTDVHLEAELRPVRTQLDVQNVSLQYESRSTPTPPWQVDPLWSYVMPIPRADGFIVRRKSLVKMVPNPMNPYMPPIPDSNSFETLAAKGNYFIGTTAINTKWTPQTLQMQQVCRFSPGTEGCDQFIGEFKTWVAAVIAVHLTTFPIG
jgi:hypothetical protein